MKLPHKTLEKKLFQAGYKRIIGVDEVGMGCLAGPVVVCAVSFSPKFYRKSHKKLHWLRDSKLLQADKREEFAKELKKQNVKFKLSFCYPKTIDNLNIYQAARFAMKRAVERLAGKCVSRQVRKQKGLGAYKLKNLRTIILVDGPHKIKGLDMEQMPIVKGDRKIFAIACASILAKVSRDKTMRRYAKKFPKYGFEKHKGYGTKHHQAQLVSFGPSKIHRKSFAPVAKLL